MKYIIQNYQDNVYKYQQDTIIEGLINIIFLNIVPCVF